MRIVINWILFIMVITVNALANILPINGYNTGQVSGFYPNYFVPAGFTFAIWGIIYLFFLSYSIAFTYFTIKQNDFPEIKKYLNAITPYYWATCILNAAWILAWHYLQVALSVLIILLFLFSMIQIFIKSHQLAINIKIAHWVLIKTPFSIYIGWLSVATIANITALLVHLQWNGFGLDPIYWSVIMIVIAICFGLFFITKFKTVSYPLVIAWALWGIKASQGPQVEIINQASMIGLLLLLVVSSKLTIQKLIVLVR